jgi:hypothetical protein
MAATCFGYKAVVIIRLCISDVLREINPYNFLL